MIREWLAVSVMHRVPAIRVCAPPICVSAPGGLPSTWRQMLARPTGGASLRPVKTPRDTRPAAELLDSRGSL